MHPREWTGSGRHASIAVARPFGADLLDALDELRLLKRLASRLESRLKVSTIVDADLPPGSQLVMDETMAQTSFVDAAGLRSSRSFAFTLRLGALLRNCRPNSR